MKDKQVMMDKDMKPYDRAGSGRFNPLTTPNRPRTRRATLLEKQQLQEAERASVIVNPPPVKSMVDGIKGAQAHHHPKTVPDLNPHPNTGVIPHYLQRISKNLSPASLATHESSQVRKLAGEHTPLQLAALVGQRKLLLVEAVMRHASRCMDTKCLQVGCTKMKGNFSHAKNCRKEEADPPSSYSSSPISSIDPQNNSKRCNICQQLVFLFTFHARHCYQKLCMVPYCGLMRTKMGLMPIEA